MSAVTFVIVFQYLHQIWCILNSTFYFELLICSLCTCVVADKICRIFFFSVKLSPEFDVLFPVTLKSPERCTWIIIGCMKGILMTFSYLSCSLLHQSHTACITMHVPAKTVLRHFPNFWNCRLFMVEIFCWRVAVLTSNYILKYASFENLSKKQTKKKKRFYRCFMRKEMHSSGLLDLKDAQKRET